jgi:hypothetical protein
LTTMYQQAKLHPDLQARAIPILIWKTYTVIQPFEQQILPRNKEVLVDTLTPNRHTLTVLCVDTKTLKIFAWCINFFVTQVEGGSISIKQTEKWELERNCINIHSKVR